MVAIYNKQNSLGYVSLKLVGETTGGVKLNDEIIGANSTASESVQSLVISNVFWNTPSGQNITIKRGTNTIAILSGSGSFDLQENQMTLEANTAHKQANVNITNTDANTTIILRMHKIV
jgi:hypothetical protein